MGKFENFMAYRMLYARGQEDCDKRPSDTVTEEKILAPWKAAKAQYLNKLFGEGNVILEKQISYERGKEQTRREFSDWVDDACEVRDFIWPFREKMAAYLDLNIHDSWRWSRYLDETDFDSADEERKEQLLREQFMEYVIYATTVDYLMDNSLPLDKDLRIKDHHTGKMLVISRQEKVMKLLGKFAKLVHMEEQFEAFRIGHSRVLNTNKLKGTLCLSIHPLDYATASDNANGWSSCMSWQENGCYRMGTVEMMNSPMVICCYLKSKQNEITFRWNRTDYEWNSKKWRAWAILDEHQCLINRQYPYDNDQMVKFCLDWIRELAHNNLGWDFGEQELIYGQNPDHHSGTDVRPGYRLQYETVHMYNDININGEGNWAMLREGFEEKFEAGLIHIHVSGVAECMCCGEIIDEKDHADTLFGCCCDEDCSTRCECCGDRLYDGDIYWGPDDRPYCESCYNDHFVHCTCCDTDCESDTAVQFAVDLDTDMIEKTINENPFGVDEDTIERWKHRARWGYENLYNADVTMCQDCREGYELDLDDMFMPARRRWDKHLRLSKVKDEHLDSFLACLDIFCYESKHFSSVVRLAENDPRELRREAIRKTWQHIWKWSAIRQENKLVENE